MGPARGQRADPLGSCNPCKAIIRLILMGLFIEGCNGRYQGNCRNLQLWYS